LGRSSRFVAIASADLSPPYGEPTDAAGRGDDY
jgi:hypothetical protein